jgi:predicted XRE-type DNA-binding protein
VAQNQDFSVIVSDHHNRRGTGKTVLSLKLAAAMDRTEEGLTSEKVSLSPEELAAAYIDQPRGSALVLDEAEAGLSKYRAGSSANMAMRQLVSMGRIEEKYLVMNLPAAGELDRDLQALCDWQKPMTPKTEVIEWTDLQDPQLLEVYDELTEEKRAHLRGETSDAQHLTQQQHRQLLEQAEEAASISTRDRIIRQLREETDLTQREIAAAVGLSRSRVASIATAGD